MSQLAEEKQVIFRHLLVGQGLACALACLITLPATVLAASPLAMEASLGAGGSPDWQRHFDFSHPQSGLDLFARQIREIASHSHFSRALGSILLDAGVSRSREREVLLSPGMPRTGIDYQDLFVGVRYRGLGGRAWRLDPRSSRSAGFDSRWYYEAGMERRLSDNWSVSVQLGGPLDRNLLTDPALDISLGTRYRFRGFDLGLRLVDQSSRLSGTHSNGLSLLGSVSRRFP